jgi:hypothetical protein
MAGSWEAAPGCLRRLSSASLTDRGSKRCATMGAIGRWTIEGREMGDLLDKGNAGLVIVAVNPKVLANADNKVVQDNVSDTKGTLQQMFESAE